MRDELSQYEQIDRYLKHQLSGTELSAFESQLKEDSSLLEEVNSHRALHELVVDRGLIDVKKKLQRLDADGHSSGNWKRYTGIISVAAILIVGSLIVTNKTVSNQPRVEGKPEKVLPVTPSSPIVAIPAPEKKSSHQSEEKVTIQSSQEPKKPAVQLQEYIAETSPTKSETAVNKSFPIASEKAILEGDQHNSDRKETTETVPCTVGNSSLQITTEESCSDSPTGKITITKASSLVGLAPFLFSVDGKNYVASNMFDNLYGGTYTVYVKDARGCVGSDTDIRIKEKECRIYEYAFYPARQEIWKFPIDNNLNGKIEIYNRNGSLVYTSQIVNSYPDSWNGMSEDQPLPMGSYSFILRTPDRVMYGNVTLLQ